MGDVCLGVLGVFPDLVLILQATGIDYGEFDADPFRRAIDTIARGPRLILDDGAPLTDEPVKQGGFPNVRTTDDGDDGFNDLNSNCWGDVQRIASGKTGIIERAAKKLAQSIAS